MQEERPTVRLSGAQADLLNEGSGYLLGGGEAAKGALEEAASGLVLTGNFVDNIFDLAERKRALDIEDETSTCKNKL